MHIIIKTKNGIKITTPINKIILIQSETYSKVIIDDREFAVENEEGERIFNCLRLVEEEN